MTSTRLERIPGVASAFTVAACAGKSRSRSIRPASGTQRHARSGRARPPHEQHSIPLGWIENEHQEFTLQTAGEYSSLEEIENTTVAMRVRA